MDRDQVLLACYVARIAAGYAPRIDTKTANSAQAMDLAHLDASHFLASMSPPAKEPATATWVPGAGDLVCLRLFPDDLRVVESVKDCSEHSGIHTRHLDGKRDGGGWGTYTYLRPATPAERIAAGLDKAPAPTPCSPDDEDLHDQGIWWLAEVVGGTHPRYIANRPQDCEGDFTYIPDRARRWPTKRECEDYCLDSNRWRTLKVEPRQHAWSDAPTPPPPPPPARPKFKAGDRVRIVQYALGTTDANVGKIGRLVANDNATYPWRVDVESSGFPPVMESEIELVPSDEPTPPTATRPKWVRLKKGAWNEPLVRRVLSWDHAGRPIVGSVINFDGIVNEDDPTTVHNEWVPADAPAKDRFDCATCGLGVKADEDGCCASCGMYCAVVKHGEYANLNSEDPPATTATFDVEAETTAAHEAFMADDSVTGDETCGVGYIKGWLAALRARGEKS